VPQQSPYTILVIGKELQMKTINRLLSNMAENRIFPQQNDNIFKLSPDRLQRFTIEGYDHGDPMGWLMFDKHYGLCVYGVEGNQQHWVYIDECMSSRYTKLKIDRFTDEALAKEDEYRSSKAYKYRTKYFEHQNNWNHSYPINDQHKILRKLGIKSSGLQQFNKDLITPIFDGLGTKVGTQFFTQLGRYFYKAYPLPIDGRCYIGNFSDHTNVAVCEDWLTGAKIHEIARIPVVVCLNSKNLLAVTADIRSKYPNHSLQIWSNHSRDSITAAKKASALFSARLFIPEKMRARINTSFYDRVRKYGPGEITIPFEEAKYCEGTYYAN